MENNIVKVVDDLREYNKRWDYKDYWHGFKKMPFAVYNDSEVYLADYEGEIDGFRDYNDHIKIGKRTNQFFGNTNIELSGVNTAIIMQGAAEREIGSTYPLLVHESFHGFQRGWYNPKSMAVLPAFYPLDSENMHLRVKERRVLLKAVFEKDGLYKEQLIKEFIRIRERREELFPEFVNFENDTELNEGTATFVEYKAKTRVSDLPKEYLLSSYGKDLVEYKDAFEMFRKTCYNSGLFLCVLLDQIDDNWQKDIVQRDMNLFQALKEKMKVEAGSGKERIEYVQNPDIDNILEECDKEKDRIFQEFHNSEGYRVEIVGACFIGADPMNVIGRGDELISKHVALLSIGENQYYLKGMTYISFGDNWVPKKVVFFCHKKPLEENGRIIIEDLGEFNKENIVM